MHPAISINTLCFARGGLEELSDTVARIGARGISPDLEHVVAHGVPATTRLFRDAGLEVTALTHRAFAFTSPEDAAAARERLDRTIDIAAQIGAQSIVITTGGRGPLCWTDAVERFAEAIGPCADNARAAGIAIGVEPTSHLYADVSIAHRLSDTVHVVGRAGLSAVIDLFACWVDADIDLAIAQAAPRASLVQVSDYVYGDRGLPCRTVPGDGDIPLDRLIPAIISAGYRGYFDLEIIGPRLWAEGEDAGLRRAGDYVGALIDQAGTN